MRKSANGGSLPTSDGLHCTRNDMTYMLLLQLAALALHWDVQVSNTTAGLRGLRAVSPQIAWASGTKGTFLTTTDGGSHWRAGVVPGAEALDFRDVEAFDAKTAYLLASGQGENSRVYKTNDAGAHWELLFANPDKEGFFDALAFWDEAHGLLLGDPVAGRFAIFATADAGKTWQRQQAPSALSGEGAFAASGTCLIARGKQDAWFATGGPGGARVFRTHAGDRSWRGTAAKTAGIFSLAFDGKNGIAVGGDYQKPNATERTLALTHNGGKKWISPAKNGLSYRSGVAFAGNNLVLAVGTSGSDVSRDGGSTWEHFSDVSLNAVAANGGALWAVGPKGVIVKLSREH
jgi:photosystem II stability/assembly factor-like uncharacterized protein